MISINLSGLGILCCRTYAAIAMRASASVTWRYARMRQRILFALSCTSVATVGISMVRALSMGDGWNCHSRKVPRATSQAQVAINSEAHQMVREVA